MAILKAYNYVTMYVVSQDGALQRVMDAPALEQQSCRILSASQACMSLLCAESAHSQHESTNTWCMCLLAYARVSCCHSPCAAPRWARLQATSDPGTTQGATLSCCHQGTGKCFSCAACWFFDCQVHGAMCCVLATYASCVSAWPCGLIMMKSTTAGASLAILQS